MLYFRQILILLVSLYTVRIVLKTLGTVDYGIQNVVGGVVVMLSFFSSTMTASSMRFFAFELGRKNYVRLNHFFNLTALIYLALGGGILILSETIGLWFVETQMVIPENRMTAALWVYQFSVASFILQLFVTPYRSIIIAYEEMSIYAYVSVLEAVLKLVAVYVLLIVEADKLKAYAVLLFMILFISSAVYIIYSSYKYKVCKLFLFWDSAMFNELLSYSGWSFFGALAGMIKAQGINILLNLFFNPTVNAARGVAYQVNSSLNLFTTNFFQAVRPQITKSYAAGENREMMELVFRSSRFCYYLIMLFAVPILFETPYILSLWLGEIPEHTVLFTRLVVITTMVESISYPLITAVSSTGNIKLYQVVTGGLLILNLPFSYISLRLGYPPEVTMYIAIGTAIISQISRVLFVSKMHEMSIKQYVKETLLVILLVTILTGAAPYIVAISMKEGFIRLLILTGVFFSFTLPVIYFIGVTSVEREMLKSIIKQKIYSTLK